MKTELTANRNLGLLLLHYPVYNKHHEVVTTAVTNLDIHDIARAACTYGVSRYYLVTPSLEQQSLVKRIIGHWQDGWGSEYNPDRRDALEIARVASTIEEAVNDFQKGFNTRVKTIATGASPRIGDKSFSEIRQAIEIPDHPHLLIMGTGWGLADSVFENADMTIEPIRAAGSYNHLSVRSATAIMLDRLLGEGTDRNIRPT